MILGLGGFKLNIDMIIGRVDYMERLIYLNNLLDILIEKEREKKEECRDNWTVSEYAFHNGMETAYSNIKREIRISLVPD